MKIVSLLLFLIGTLWAYVCIGFASYPFQLIYRIIEGSDEWDIGWPYHLLFTLFFLNSIVGYWVWWGWLHFFRKEKYLGRKRKNFWAISLANHACWILLLPILFGSILADDSGPSSIVYIWSTGVFEGGWIYLIWPMLLAILSGLFLNKPNPSNQAEVATPAS